MDERLHPARAGADEGRLLKGGTHHPHKAERVRNSHPGDSQREKAKPTEFGTLVKVQEAEKPVRQITKSAPNGCRMGNFGSPLWSAMNRSSRSSLLAHRRCSFQFGRPTIKRPKHAGAARGAAAQRTLIDRPWHIKSDAGFGGRCPGAPDAKGRSALSRNDMGSLVAAIGAGKEWNVG